MKFSSDALSLKRRYNVIETGRTNIQSTWDIIERFITPYRGRMFNPENSELEIDWRKREFYDSTAINSAPLLAASIHGNVTNPKVQWFDYSWRDKELRNDQESVEWLEAATAIQWQSLTDSDWDIEIQEVYMDLVGFGTGCLVGEPIDEVEWKGYDFQSVPTKEIYFERGADGQVLFFYRKFQWYPIQIYDKFGDKIPQYIKDDCDNPKGLETKYDVIFAIFPRENYKTADTSKMITPDKRPFGKKYFMLKDCEELGEEGGYYEMPVWIPPWAKTSGSVWGYSPSMLALGAVLTCNQVTEMELVAAEKVIDPPTKVTERGLLSDLDLQSGGLTVVRDMKDMEPYESGANFQISNLQIERLQRQIERIYYVDQLELKDSPAMTATEVSVRYELMQRLLGPTLGRIEKQLLDPALQAHFSALYRAGQFPEEPALVKKLKGKIDIDYLGPLPRAQKTDIVTSIERFLANGGQLIEVKPETLDIIDFDDLMRHMARALNIPATGVKSTDAVKVIRDERKAQQEEAQAIAKAEAQGNAAQSTGQGMQAMQEGGGMQPPTGAM